MKGKVNKFSLLVVFLLVVVMAFAFVACNEDVKTNDAETISTLKTEVSSAVRALSAAKDISINEDQSLISFTVENATTQIDVSAIKLTSASLSVTTSDGTALNALVLQEGENTFRLSATAGSITVSYTLKITRAAAAPASATHTHTYADAWSKDANYHWHAATCEHTTEVSGKAAHTWNDGVVTTPATEEKEGVKTYTCTVCGQTKTEPVDKLHKHTYADAWSKDANYHWHAATCEHTTEVSGKAAHTWNAGVITTPATEETEGEKTYTCTVCGQTKTESINRLVHTHTYARAWSKDETYHWHASTCGHADEIKDKAAHRWGAGQVTKKATETAEGEMTYTCVVCSATKTEPIEKLDHEHKYSRDWMSDADYHWHASTCGHADAISGKAAHRWGAGQVTKQATETEEGEMTYICIVCAAKKTEPIEMLDHEHKYSKDWTSDETGHWHAVICGHEDAPIEKLDHVWDGGEITTTPTEERAGVKTYKCIYCEYTKTEPIARLEHTHKYSLDWVTTDETYHWHASICGHEDEISGKAEHTWDAGEITTQPTEERTGVKTYTCTVCGRTKTEELDKLEHVHVFTEQIVDTEHLANAATCTTKAQYYYSCACGEKGTQTFEAGGYAHEWNVEEATCQTAKFCTLCGMIAEQQKEHDYQYSEDLSTAPSCGVAGERVTVCSMCGDEIREPIDALSHNYGDWNTVRDATCSVPGLEQQVCANCGDVKERELPTIDHVWNADAATCETAKYCTVCETVAEPALGHDYQPNAEKSFAATCLNAGKSVQTCTKCGKDLENDLPPKGHTSDGNWVKGDPALVEGETCKYVTRSVSRCADCGEEIVKEEIADIHDYAGVITTPATCSAAGVKTYTCSKCDHSYEESYTDPDAHKYDAGETEGGVTTYTCEYCVKTYTVLSYKEEAGATVDADDLKDAGSIELSDAAITFDEDAKGVLEGSVEISASAASAETLGVTSDKVPADATVYNIQMSSNGNAVSQLGGTATVKVPYELKEGDDADNIAVYYIDDEGQVETIAAKYTVIDGVGYAIFETTHFSYYTVTLLTPEERCELYGHVDSEKRVEKTCTLDGYIYKVCKRCGRTEFEVPEELKATGHELNESVVAATCTKDGYTEYTCAHCSYKYREYTPATGHDYVENDEKYVAPTCAQVGKTYYKCANCAREYFVTVQKLPHSFIDSVTEPTCVKGGYTTHTCENCPYSYKDSETKALGHDYVIDEENCVASTCTVAGVNAYKCTRCDATKTAVAPTIPHTFVSTVTAPTCTEGGYTEYVCSECTYTYRDRATDALGHDYVIDDDHCVAATCVTTGINAYQCTRCDAAYTTVAPLAEHTYEVTSVIAPTCEAGGYTLYTCAVCDDTYSANATKALGHNYVIDEKNSVAATCTETGINAYQCTRCDATYTAVAPLADHEIDASVIAPTCLEGGYTKYECKNCGYSYYGAPTEALGHDYVLDANASTATSCTAAGLSVYKCSRCDDGYSEVEPMIDHKFVKTVVDPTCLAGGYTEYTCAYCAMTYRENESDALGHDHVRDAERSLAATCTEDGYTLYACTRCDSTYREPIAAKGHVWDIDEPTCGKGQTCVVCGAAGQPATGNHTMVEGICSVCGQGCEHTFTDVITAPTCAEVGYTTRTCSKCGFVDVTDFVPATGKHTYAGSSVCSVCGHLCEHTFADVITQPTCVDEGYTTRTCVDCGYSEKVNPVAPTGKHVYKKGKCVVCGAEKPASDDATSYYVEMMKSLVDQPIYIYIDEFTESYSYTYSNRNLEVRYSVSGIKDTELYIRKNEKGLFDGNVKGVMISQYEEYSTYDDARAGIRYIDFVGVLKDNVFYFTQTQTNDEAGERIATIEMQTYLGEILNSYLPIRLAYSYGMISQAIDFVEDTVLPYAENLSSDQKTLLYEAIDAIFESFTNVTETEDGKKTVSLDLSAVDGALEFLQEATVSELINKLAGSSHAYDTMSDAILSVFDLTVADVIDFLESKGVNIDDAIDAFFKYYKKGEELYNAGKLDSFLQYLPNAILKMLPEELDVEELDRIVLRFLKGVYESENLDGDTLQAYLKSLVKNRKFRASKLTDVVVDFGFADADMIREVKRMTAETLEYLKDARLSRVIPYFDKYLDKFGEPLAMITEALKLSFVTDADGSVEHGTVTFDLTEGRHGAIIIARILTEYTLTGDYEGIIERLEGIVDTEAVLAAILAQYPSVDTLTYDLTSEEAFTATKVAAEPVYDGEGKLVGAYIYQREQRGRGMSSGGSRVSYYFEISRKYFSVDSKSLLVTRACAGDIEYDFLCTQESRRDEIIIAMVNGEITTTENIGEYSVNHYTSTLSVVYYAETNTYVVGGEFELGHEWELDESATVTPTACGEEERRVYLCKHCGATMIETELKAHTPKLEYVFADPEHPDCTDGVTARLVCTDCGEVLLEKTYTDHVAMVPVDFSEFEGVCEAHNELFGVFGTCPCGAYVDVDDDYYGFSGTEYRYYTVLLAMRHPRYYGGSEEDWIFEVVSERDNKMVLRCKECGLTVTLSRTDTQLNACRLQREESILFELGDVKKQLSQVSEVSNHNTMTFVELAEGSTTCTDGVIVRRVCTRCGEVVDTYEQYYHYTGIIRTEDLGNGVTLYIQGCACGQSDGGYSVYYNGTNLNRAYDHELGRYVYVAGDLRFAIAESYSAYDEHCRRDKTLVVTYADGTQRTITLGTVTNHNTLRFVEFAPGSTTCEDGVIARDICTRCGEVLEEYFDRYHTTGVIRTEEILNGVYLYIYGCPCGYYNEGYSIYYNGTYLDKTWVDPYGYVYVVGNTGFKITEEYGEYDEHCECDKSLVVTFEDSSQRTISLGRVTNHNRFTFVELMEGSETCEDGVWIREKCLRCGEVFSESTRTSHYSGVTYAEDLGDGITICARGCACGYDNGGYNVYYNGQYLSDRYVEGFGYVYVAGDRIFRVSQSYGDPDEHCVCERIFTLTFKDGTQRTITLGTVTRHNTRDFVELAEGSTTCEDGVIVRNVCTRCGEVVNEYRTDDHRTGVIRAEDLGGGVTLYVSGCPCGYYSGGYSVYYNGTYLNMTDDDELGHSVYVAGDLRFTITESYGDLDEQCRCDKNLVVTFYPDGTQRTVAIGTVTRHNTRDFVELMEGSTTCEDGIWVREICVRCGEVVNTYEEHYHDTGVIRTVDLGDGVNVYLYGCACGERVENVYVYRNGEQVSHYEHIENGIRYIIDDKDLVLIEQLGDRDENCKRTAAIVITYGDAEPITLDVGEITDHDTRTFVELMEGSTTCNDGVWVREKCVYCGKVMNEYHQGYHYTGITRTEDLGNGVKLYVRGCACGQNSSGYNVYYNETYIYSYWDDELNREVYPAGDLRFTISSEYGEYDEHCRQDKNLVLTFYPDGTQRTIAIGKVTNHNTVSFVELAEGSTTCEDGIWVREICLRCGEVVNTYEEHYHYTGVIRTEDLGDGLKVYIRGCACGQRDGGYEVYYNGTYLNTTYDYELGRSVYVAGDLRFTISSEYGEYDEHCRRDRNLVLTFYPDGTQRTIAIGKVTNHNTVSFVELAEGSTTCEDGVIVRSVCTRCGEVVNTYEEHYHYTGVIRTEDLGDGVTLYIRGCACGQRDGGYEVYYNGTYLNPTYDYELSREVYTAGDLRFTTSTEYGEYDEHCRRDRNLVLTFYPDGTQRTIAIGKVTNHNTVSFVELMEGSKTCEDGIWYKNICVRCGEVVNTYEEYYHDTGVIRTEDLGEGAKLYVSGCACGASSDYGWSVYRNGASADYDWVVIEGVEWRMYTFENSRVLMREALSEPVNCKSDRNLIVRLGYDVDAGTYDSEMTIFLREEDNHSVVRTYELREGSKTCYDGIYAIDTCSVCGKELNRYSTSDHRGNLVETIELSAYGSVCGAVAKVYECPCGASRYLNIESPSNDFEQNFIGSFYTQDGCYYSEYLYTCAVTDPAPCGFRYAERYKEVTGDDDCHRQVIRYYIFGCDEQGNETAESRIVELSADRTYTMHVALESTTDEYVAFSDEIPCLKKALVTESCAACGYEHSYYVYTTDHTWSETAYNEDAGKGRTLHADAHDWCSVCGCGNYSIRGSQDEILDSYYVGCNYSDYYYEQYINYKGNGFITYYCNLDSGEITEENRYYYTFFGTLTESVLDSYEAGSSLYECGLDKEAIRATLAETDECYRLEVRLVDGTLCIVGFYNCCYGWSSWYTDIPATCTQYGIGGYVDLCICCGKELYSEGGRVIRPTGHVWESNAEGDGYVCQVCGVKNAVGANGSVVLEDCTDYANAPDTYVAGYYDPTGRDFLLAISLINKADHSVQYVLASDIAMSVTGLGINGKPIYRYTAEGHYIRFSRSDVLAIAATEYPELDLSEYDIRLSFVPMGGDDGNLDYGITFEDRAATEPQQSEEDADALREQIVARFESAGYEVMDVTTSVEGADGVLFAVAANKNGAMASLLYFESEEAAAEYYARFERELAENPELASEAAGYTFEQNGRWIYAFMDWTDVETILA